ncbi:hypothetical protein [Labedaea rhizosphaerae]|uniref:hypothetical protein n=1 Tax=Labedaea rhizosphaerae TaxID=598644 RepID=UPI001060CE3D|nr:hypothetical protein [Labedaea rhizosphaerae]
MATELCFDNAGDGTKCTKKKGHNGDHVGTAGPDHSKVVGRWTDERADVVSLEDRRNGGTQ